MSKTGNGRFESNRKHSGMAPAFVAGAILGQTMLHHGLTCDAPRNVDCDRGTQLVNLLQQFAQRLSLHERKALQSVLLPELVRQGMS